MTIALSLKVNDGLILAADSAATLLTQGPGGAPGVVNVYNNANKIFNLKKNVSLGAITWGLGSIGNASMALLMKELRERFSGSDPQWKIDDHAYAVEDVARKVRQYLFDEKYENAFRNVPANSRPSLGMIVAGYSTGQDMAEEYQITIANGMASGLQLLRPKEESGVTWNGVIEPLSRLLVGYDPRLESVLRDQLGIPQDQATQAMAIIQQSLYTPLVIPPMPLQDAIELARFLVDLATNYARFAPGAPTVGGPTEIAVISKHEGFKWVNRKYYYNRELNP